MGFDQQYISGIEWAHPFCLSVVKLNETTIVSACGDHTLRVWDLTKKFAPEDISAIAWSNLGVINSDSDYYSDDY